MDKAEQVLGNQAVWGGVGYSGTMHAPCEGTYPGIDAIALNYSTVDDSGDHPTIGDGAIANLRPLIMAALYEVGFAWEAGPLTSWSN